MPAGFAPAGFFVRHAALAFRPIKRRLGQFRPGSFCAPARRFAS